MASQLARSLQTAAPHRRHPSIAADGLWRRGRWRVPVPTTHLRLILCVLIVGGLLLPHVAHAAASDAAPGGWDRKEALGVSQAVVGKAVADHHLVNRRGDAVSIARYAGKPLIVSFIFTSCHHTCPLITQNLISAVSAANDVFGADAFNVITVGFDTANDTPARMRAYANSQGIDAQNWDLLSGDRKTIAAFAEDLGFIYFPSSRGFDHLAQVSVLDGEGRVVRQVYGSNFAPPAIVEPLKSMIFGKAAESFSMDGLINKVRLFCTIYNPNSNSYRFDYSLLIAIIAGFMSLGGVGFVLVRAWLRQPSSSSRHG